jgi:hypothetical protein
MRSRVLLSAAAAVAAAAALAPAGAGAATWCVPATGADGCAGDHVSASVAAAVAAADTAPGPDTVLIGAGVHNLGDGVSVGSETTELVGAGRDETVLTVDPLQPDDGFTRRIVSGYMSRLADLTLRLASADLDDGNNGSVEGADVYDGIVEHVRVDADGAVFGDGDNDGRGSALLLRNGALRDVEVDFAPGSDTEGLTVGGWHLGEPVELTDVRVRSDVALRVSPQPVDEATDPVVRVRRTRLDGVVPVMVSSGVVDVSDSVVASRARRTRWEGDTTAALYVTNGYPKTPASVTLDRVTLVARGGQPAGDAPHYLFNVGGNGGTAHPARVQARHLLASGFDRTLLRGDWGGAVDVAVASSLLDVRDGAESVVEDPDGSGGGSATVALGGNRTGDPLFADAAAGDWRVRAGSPAVDVGGEELIAGEPTDLAGAPRPADGDGDGVIAADAGAFEHQYVAPHDPGTGGPGGSGGGSGGAGGGPQPRPADRVAPVVRGLRWAGAARRGAAARRGGAVGAPGPQEAKARTAGTLRFVLSERAKVVVTVERRAGRRWTRVGTVRAGWRAKGRAAVVVGTRLGRSALPSGALRATVVATDGAGNRSKPRAVRFAHRR